MSETMQVRVPNIGDFGDVEVIELLVKEGDAIEAEQSLITVESDKASMEIPSPSAGVVKKLLLGLGDKVSEGSPILELEMQAQPARAAVSEATQAPAAPQAPAASRTPAAAPAMPQAPAAAPAASQAAAAASAATQAATRPSEVDLECAVLVLGSGPGGYAAAFRAADLGLDTVLVERHAALGGVCLNVGCIPSKALLHVASLVDEARHFASLGVDFGEPRIDLERLRAHKAAVVGRLTGGVAAMARARKVRVVRGYGRFVDAHHVEVEVTSGEGQDKTGEKKIVRFEQAIIAAGSMPIRLPFLPDDPRIVDSTGALELSRMPKRMLVIGGGIIGLEMATVYSTLGARVEVVEMLDRLMAEADRDLVRVWQKFNAARFDRVMLQTKSVRAEAAADGIRVWFEGANAPESPQTYDLVLSAVGRSPNGAKIGAANAGVEVDARGFVPVDAQMRTNVAHVFAIGDVARAPMLAHKATHEGHVAAEAAAGQKSAFDARVIPSVAYTDPEVAWVGLSEDDARERGIELTRAAFPWSASGRAIANARDEGFTKLLFDPETHRIVGGAIVGTNAGDLIGEIALAIEMGADATDIGRTIHPHPTLGETIGLAAEVGEGICTDLLPPRKR